MPGVPSSRGCDACRKQKKKCDQTRPVCSRCKRLNVACIGAGEQRYKFKDQTGALTAKAAQKPVPKTACWELASLPSSETTIKTCALISTLQVVDIRYDVSYYGAFIKDIPRRLGNNEALDAAAGALSSAYVSLHTRQQSVSTFSEYGNALKALRLCLDDPVKANSADTLCAIYLVMICQGWIGLGNALCHGEVVLQILKAATRQRWSSEFEVSMLTTLAVPVIIESIVNPKIKLQPWFLEMIELHSTPKPRRRRWEDRYATEEDLQPLENGITSMSLQNLAKLPAFFHQPESNLLETVIAYQRQMRDCDILRKRLEVSMASCWPRGYEMLCSPTPLQKIFAQTQAAYGLLLGITQMLSSVLRASDPCNITLAEESIFITNEILKLAEPASYQRPLGSCYYPLALISVYAATESLSLKDEVTVMLVDWGSDLGGSDWTMAAKYLEETVDGIHTRFWGSSGSEPQRVFRELKPEDKCCVQ